MRRYVRTKPFVATKSVILGAMIFASAAQAQKTTRIEIELKPCVNTPTRISFVLNGTEQQDLDLTARHWIISLPDDEFVIQDACASLRLGGARTDCRRPVSAPDPEHRYAPLARFTFACDEQDAWPVVVRTDPKIPVSYVRKIENGNTSRDPRSCQCREANSFFDGKRTFRDVRFPVEKLLLQLGVAAPNDQALGLHLDAIKLRKNPKKDEYSFDRTGVVGLLSIQRARGDGSAPTLSSTAIDLDTANLKKLPLTNLTLTVN
jgi:hypothetical protein